MSFTVLARQPLLRSHPVSTVRAGNIGLTALPLARTYHTPSNAPPPRRSLPFKTLSGGLVAAGSGWIYLSSLNPAETSRSFSIHSPLESEGKDITGSSTLVRPASPAAPRRQTVTLVFLTSEATSKGAIKSLMSNFGGGGGGEREKWFSWIGYFREAGYDCLQMNLALRPAARAEGQDKEASLLTDELHTQIRLSNLQRQPVMFVHHSSDSDPNSTAQIVSKYIEPGQGSSSGGGFLGKIFGGGGMFGSRPAISGLVVVSDLDDATAMTLFGKHPKLNTLIVANGGASTKAAEGKVTVLDAQGKGHEKVIKDIERWLIKEGYEG